MAVALIVAAGRGERLGFGRPKALVPLCGQSMLAWSVGSLRAVAAVSQIVVALPAEALDSAPDGVTVVAGGAQRSQSVRAALAAAGVDADPVIVHDAARPLATPDLFTQALEALALAPEADAVIAATPVSDTIKEVADDGRSVTRTLDRARLWAVQTPQVFRRGGARARAGRSVRRAAGTGDRRRLADRTGGWGRPRDRLRSGEPEDHHARGPARRRAAARRTAVGMSTGLGYDCHRFAAGRPLVLGGVTIEHDRGLDGHSDADVLTHAIIDAMLGACALGDIGQHFPDTDPRFRGADSIELLRATVALLADAGFVTSHVDATVVIERPKLAPVRDAMRARLAERARPRPRARQRQSDPGRGDGLRRARRGRGGAGDRDRDRPGLTRTLAIVAVAAGA